jgi:Zn-dependent protease with chaperone function
LTVLVILGAWDLGRRESAFEHRAFKLLVTGMVALDGVVLASALTRLALYEGRFGFTMKRFAGYVAIGGIGAVLVALVLMIWIERRDVLVASIMAVVAATLLVANVMNPERFVATRNVARYQATSRIDVNYLAFGLGPDAIPVTAPLLRNLSPEEAATLLAGLCAASAELDGEPGWRSANAGRANARAALRAAGIDRHRCELVSRDAKTLPPGVSG